MSTVLVTGATGQVGSRLVRKLLRRGDKVLAFVLPDDPLRERLAGLDVEVVEGNLLDAQAVEAAVSRADAVIHTANFVGRPQGMDESAFFDNNVRSTLHLALAAGRRAEQIQWFVHISSSAVYPNDSHMLAPCYHPVDEEHPKRYSGVYALSKWVGEDIVGATRRETGLQTVIIRPSGIVSGEAILSRYTVGFAIAILRTAQRHPRSEIHHPEIAEMLKELEQADPKQPLDARDADGRSWLYQPADARDVAEACVVALEEPNAVGEAFNVAAPRPIPFSEAAPLISEATGLPVLTMRFPVRFIYDLSVVKAKTLLRYQPRWDIEPMVRSASAVRRGEASGYEDEPPR